MRIENAFRNSFFSVISQVILIVVGFFCQRVMNLRLGEELVGMNSVISNVIALLSVTELGMSVAVVYHLYHAIAENSEERIAALLNLYRRAYYIFAMVIFVLGLIVLPFIHIFLRENSFSLAYVRTIFVLWILRTIVSYLFSYKRSILVADQQEYVVSVATLFANIANYLLIIIIVELSQNYILALSLNIFIDFLTNLWISRYVNIKYPFLKKRRGESLESNVVNSVLYDIKSIFVTRLSTKLLLCSDSLIMSSFISVKTVGLYSNYTMITQSLTNIVVAFSNALQPSVGNMFIEKDHEKEYGVLRQITFLFFMGTSFAVTSLFALMTPFVTDIWLNKEYALEVVIVLWCVINFFMSTMGTPLGMMMGVTGLFVKERNLAIIVAVLNIVLSLALVVPFGIPGVLFGTFVAYFTQIIYRMITLIHIYMKRSCRRYILDLLQYIVLTVMEVYMVYLLKQHIYEQDNWVSFALLICICVLIPNILNVFVFLRSWRFRSICGMMKSMCCREGK